jgi:hypothetical protein
VVEIKLVVVVVQPLLHRPLSSRQMSMQMLQSQ